MILDDIVVRGLQKEGWVEESSEPSSRLLHKEGATIKIFLGEDAPEGIYIVKVYLAPNSPLAVLEAARGV